MLLCAFYYVNEPVRFPKLAKLSRSTKTKTSLPIRNMRFHVTLTESALKMSLTVESEKKNFMKALEHKDLTHFGDNAEIQ
jgi:hypothetical protein